MTYTARLIISGDNTSVAPADVEAWNRNNRQVTNVRELPPARMTFQALIHDSAFAVEYVVTDAADEDHGKRLVGGFLQYAELSKEELRRITFSTSAGKLKFLATVTKNE